MQDLETDEELANVATVSAGNNKDIGDMICLAMQKVGRSGVVTMEESRTAEDNLNVVEGMQACFSPLQLSTATAPANSALTRMIFFRFVIPTEMSDRVYCQPSLKNRAADVCLSVVFSPSPVAH